LSAVRFQNFILHLACFTCPYHPPGFIRHTSLQSSQAHSKCAVACEPLYCLPNTISTSTSSPLYCIHICMHVCVYVPKSHWPLMAYFCKATISGPISQTLCSPPALSAVSSEHLLLLPIFPAPSGVILFPWIPGTHLRMIHLYSQK
jgi:hypothetical protein